jgi:hypothetical protein
MSYTCVALLGISHIRARDLLSCFELLSQSKSFLLNRERLQLCTPPDGSPDMSMQWNTNYLTWTMKAGGYQL